MQLKSLILNCFGKHESLSQTFEPGVVVVRGDNEAGKSTMILGWMYNWFGATMLPKPLEAFVTKGAKKSSLKTTTVFEVGGVDYTCTRGPAGAELRRGQEVLVTNHGPVTAKIEELLGIPAGRAGTTIYAAQKEIEGILALGPTAVSEYIEKIADFSEVNDLLQLLDKELTTGPTRPYEEQVSAKELEIATLEAVPPADPSAQKEAVADAEAEVQKLKDQRSATQKKIDQLAADNTALQSRKDALAQELKAVTTNFKLRTDLGRTVQLAEGAPEKLQVLRDRQALADKRPALEKELKGLRDNGMARARLEAVVTAAAGAPEAIEAYQLQCLQAQQWKVYQEFLRLPAIGENVWEGDLNSLQEELRGNERQLGEWRVSKARRESEIATKEREKLTSTVCPITQKVCVELTDAALVEKNNARIEKEIIALQASVKECEKRIAEFEGTIEICNEILRDQSIRSQWAVANAAHVAWAEDQVPWVIDWLGAPPVEVDEPNGEDVSGLQQLMVAAATAKAQLEVLPASDLARETALEVEIAGLPAPVPAEELTRLQGLIDQAAAAAAKLEVLPPHVPGKETQIELELLQLPAPADATQLHAELIDLGVRLGVAELSLETARKSLNDLRQAEFYRQETIKRMKEERTKLQAGLKELQENNELIKAVKAARLLVNELLWNKVLGATSVYFSKMRGKESRVVRTPKGFVTNDEEYISGSTSDVLGLSLRVTMAKMFSTCGILVIDEGNAGASADRSAAMTATLAGAGFDQEVLVTHKDVDEAGCDQLILL